MISIRPAGSRARRLALFVLYVLLATVGALRNGLRAQEPDYARILAFEAPDTPGTMWGWAARPAETIHRDSTVAAEGDYAARMERDEESAATFSVFSLAIPADFEGERLELRGRLRTERVEGSGLRLWVRLDGPSGMLDINNMATGAPVGTTEWSDYGITLDFDPAATRVVLGVMLVGTGTAWADDLRLLVDGVPFTEAPERTIEETAISRDEEFDDGSGIAGRALNERQIRELELLARVWGFLKYHHPAVAGGEHHWDYELFRVVPQLLEAGSRDEAPEVVTDWALALGEPEPCGEDCATLPAELEITPGIEWTRDAALLDDELADFLGSVYRNRPTTAAQQYIRQNPNVRNPDFGAEGSYDSLETVDAGYRLLGLFRLWNIVEYWFPYRDVLDEDWSTVLEEYIPRVMAPGVDRDDYALALLEVVARVDDTHANLWSGLGVRPPGNEARVPVRIRHIEGEAVVVAHTHVEAGPASGLRVGDVIERVDGQPVDSLFRAWERWYAASNRPTRLRDMAANLTNGPEGPVTIEGRRASGPFRVEATRIPMSEIDGEVRWNDLPGETFRMLDDEVAYLKLSSVVASETADYVRRAQEADVLVIDIRNYPAEFVVFALGQHLVDEPTPFARFTRGDLSNPGAFSFMGPPVSLQPAEPHYDGRVVVLVDDVSVSQAEYTAMALRAAPDAIVVGSTTAGADGNVSAIPLPGGFGSMISGIGVYYPDGAPTQRVGIVPDLEVRPTIEGIRAGRDEVLEAAVSRALGREWRVPAGSTSSRR